MRRVICVAAVALFGAGLARSGDEPGSLVDKAIEAMGGKKNLAKFHAFTSNEKGTYYGMGAGLEFSGKYSVQWPNQWRMEIQDVFTIVLNGDKGWMKMGEEAREMSKEELEQQRHDLKARYMSSVLPLKSKAFKVEKIEDAKVDGRPAAGILVTRKGYPDLKMYFDKKTDLLAKTEYRTKAAEEGGKEVTQETYPSDYREVDGVKVPHKVLVNRDGKKYVEAEISNVEPKGKLDNSVFAKPGS